MNPSPSSETIAILMPAYNAEPYLAMALESLQAQTYPTWECYLMDDGSTDNTRALALSYAEKDARFHILHQENQGHTNTLNTLLDSVKEPYLMMMDSDDIIHPKTLELAIRAFREANVDLVEFDIIRVPSDFQQDDVPELDPDLAPEILTDLSIYQTRSLTPEGWINKCNKVYKSAFLSDLRFDKILRYEDDFWFNTLVHAKCQSKAIYPEALYYYRSNPTSITRSLNFDRYAHDGARRIWLTHEFFIPSGRLLEANRAAYEKDITVDAFRMVLQKNIKKNRDPASRRQLFEFAAKELAAMVEQKVIYPERLNARKRFALKCCAQGKYGMCRFAILLASI